MAGKGYIRYKLRKIPNAGPKIMPFRSKAYVKIKYIAFSKCLKNIRVERVQKISETYNIGLLDTLDTCSMLTRKISTEKS